MLTKVHVWISNFKCWQIVQEMEKVEGMLETIPILMF